MKSVALNRRQSSSPSWLASSFWWGLLARITSWLSFWEWLHKALCTHAWNYSRMCLWEVSYYWMLFIFTKRNMLVYSKPLQIQNIIWLAHLRPFIFHCTLFTLMHYEQWGCFVYLQQTLFNGHVSQPIISISFQAVGVQKKVIIRQ